MLYNKASQRGEPSEQSFQIKQEEKKAKYLLYLSYGKKVFLW